jgi:signal transduction histidine kinase
MTAKVRFATMRAPSGGARRGAMRMGVDRRMQGPNRTELRLPPLRRTLFVRFLVLIVVLVVVATALPFVPSLTHYRHSLMASRLSAVDVVALALDSNPGKASTPTREIELLQQLGAHRVEVREPDGRVFVLSEASPPRADVTYDVAEHDDLGFLIDTYATLFRQKDRVVRLRGPSTRNPGTVIDVTIDQAPMTADLRSFATSMLIPLIFVRLILLALVVVALRAVILVPLRRLTISMIAFRNRPDDPGRVIVASGREDEIGLAERELAAMQTVLRATLGQHGRLAALGEAMSKINHDLRSVLSTARLISDRLADVDDPTVKKCVPPLLSVLDQAVTLCTRTLDFAATEPVLRRTRFPLKRFIADVMTSPSPSTGAGLTLINDVPADMTVTADRDQFFRAFANLISNAAHAKSRRFSIGARRNEDRELVVTVADDGIGIPESVQANLFRPFAARARLGGTGLGLAIVREVIRAHGGTIELTSTGAMGTVFEIILPPSAMAIPPKARAARRWGSMRTIEGRASENRREARVGDGRVDRRRGG